MNRPDRDARRQRTIGLVVLIVLAALVLLAWGVPLLRWADAPSPPHEPYIQVTPVPALTTTPLHPGPSQ